MSNSLDIRLDAGLRDAVRAFVAGKARREEERIAGMELRFLFARLGFAFADLDQLATARHGRDMAPMLYQRLRARLAGERQRLCRLARCGHATYDVDRHLAVRSALRWLEGPSTAPREDAARLPGSVLNGRFRRCRPRTAP